MEYLISQVIDRNDLEFDTVARFLSDRFRSIRADYTCQHVKDRFCAANIEIMARFHIYAGYALCDVNNR